MRKRYSVWVCYHTNEGKQMDVHDYDDLLSAMKFARDNTATFVDVSVYDNESSNMNDLFRAFKMDLPSVQARKRMEEADAQS